MLSTALVAFFEEGWRDQLDRLYLKWRSGTQSQGEEEYPNTIRRKKTKCICHIWPSNCLLIHVTEGKKEGRVEVTGRWGRRRKKLWMTLRKRADTGNWRRKH